MLASTKGDASVRERLLAAADDLFYAEGVHTVGIDRILERAGVAKASLYGTFGSKEELVRVYLEQRSLRRKERISERIARYEDPRDRILSIFDLLGERARDSDFRGCAFVNACAEGPREPSVARQVSSEQRAWTRGVFTQLATDLGARDPRQVGRQLAVLYDGALIGASMDSDPSIVDEARWMAERLLDAQLATRAGVKRPRKRSPKRRRPAS
jgi:AcrR family transcriptional regulator